MSSSTLVLLRREEKRQTRVPANPRGKASRRALVVGIALLLMFAVSAFGAVEEWSELVLEAGSALLLLGWGMTLWRSEATAISLPPVVLPAAGFAALVGVQILFSLSAYRYASIHEAFLYCAYGMLFFVALQVLRTRDELRLFFFLLTLFAFSMSLLAILQNFTAGGKLYWVRQPRFGGWVFGPYVNHNHWAGFAEMMAPLPLALAASSELSRPQKLLLAFVTVLVSASVFVSGSRGGMIAITAELIGGATLLWWKKQHHRGGAKLAGLMLAVLVFALWLGGSKLLSRTESMLDSEYVTQGTRTAMARDGIRMIEARPLLGWGLDTFVTVYPKFRSFATDRLVNAAHNDYVQLGAETGLAGLALMLWFLVALFQSALREAGNGMTSRARLAALVACAGLLVHSFVDFNLHIPANAAIFYVMCAIAASEHGNRTRPQSRPTSATASTK